MMRWLAATWSDLTWRRLLITQVLGQVGALSMIFEWGYFGESLGHRSLHFVSMAVYVLFIPPVAYGADEAVKSGARPRAAYPLMVLVNTLIAFAVAGAMQRVYYRWYEVPIPDAERWGFLATGLHMSLYWTLALLMFMNKRAAERMLENVQCAELRRVELDRQLVESRLATAEAQIDPTMLFDSLARIKQEFEQASPEAEQGLNELIKTLRAALARTAAVESKAEP